MYNTPSVLNSFKKRLRPQRPSSHQQFYDSLTDSLDNDQEIHTVSNKHDESFHCNTNDFLNENTTTVLLEDYTSHAATGDEARSLMSNVLALTVDGSAMTSRIAKALLVGSMPNSRVTYHLVESGYGERSRAKAVRIIQEKNNRKRRQAAKRNIELTDGDLEQEVSRKSFDKPLSN